MIKIKIIPKKDYDKQEKRWEKITEITYKKYCEKREEYIIQYKVNN